MAGLPGSARAPPSAVKDPLKPGARHLEPVVKPDAFRDLYSHMPTRPDSNARVWGVNSFVRLRVHWGEFSEDVAQTAGYSTPSVQNLKTSLRSGS